MSDHWVPRERGEQAKECLSQPNLCTIHPLTATPRSPCPLTSACRTTRARSMPRSPTDGRAQAMFPASFTGKKQARDVTGGGSDQREPPLMHLPAPAAARPSGPNGYLHAAVRVAH